MLKYQSTVGEMKKLTFIQYYSLNKSVGLDFIGFPTNVLFLLQSNPESHIEFSCLITLVSSSLW